MTIRKDALAPNASNIVELYVIDGTALGGQLFRVTPNYGDNANVSFGGFQYTPCPIQGSQWERTINGAPPRPRLRISNVTRLLMPELQQRNDYVGAKVTRYTTLKKFLDGQPTADFTQRFPDQVYFIEEKSVMDNETIEFTLASALDLDGIALPRKQVLRDVDFPGVARYRINR